jgi:hypothetical protein
VTPDPAAPPELIDVAGMSLETAWAVRTDVERAWNEGRDTVWLTSLWASALRTLGHAEKARRLADVSESRVLALRDAHDAVTAKPTKLRRLALSHLRLTADRGSPELIPADGHGASTPDPVATTRQALERVEHEASGIETAAPHLAPESPPRGIEL